MQRPIPFAAAAAALATTGAIALGAAGATAQTGTAAATPKITGAGVGQLKIGMKFSTARAKGLVGQADNGCELDPNSRSAPLSAPLTGFVDLTNDMPRRIARISIRNGAAARGVEVGDPLTAVKAAYPKAKVDKSLVGTFQAWFVRVPKSDGGKLSFTVKKGGTHAVTQIDVPRVAFCE